MIGNRLVGEAVHQRLFVLGQVDARYWRQVRRDVQVHVGAHVRHEHRVVHGLVHEPVTLEKAQVGQRQVAAVEQADLHFFIGRHVIGELHPHFFPGRAAVDEVVFQHPLHKGFAHHWPGIVDAVLVVQLQAMGGAGHGRNAVDHGIGETHVGLDPVVQVGIVQGGKRQQRLARDGAVVRQVIAGHYGKRRGAGGAAAGQCGADETEHGGRRCGVRQVMLDLRQVGHELAGAVVDAVAAFGDGQRDDANRRVGQFVDQCLGAVLGQQHVADRADHAHLGVVGVAQFIQGEQIVLAGQVVTGLAVLGTQADPANAPVQALA